MANQLYNESMQKQNNINVDSMKNNFLQNLKMLKSQGGDPNQIIQQMLNSGKVTQQQYNDAVQKAQNLKRILICNYFGGI